MGGGCVGGVTGVGVRCELGWCCGVCGVNVDGVLVRSGCEWGQ